MYGFTHGLTDQQYQDKIVEIAALPRQGDTTWLNAVIALHGETGWPLTVIATHVNERRKEVAHG